MRRLAAQSCPCSLFLLTTPTTNPSYDAMAVSKAGPDSCLFHDSLKRVLNSHNLELKNSPQLDRLRSGRASSALGNCEVNYYGICIFNVGTPFHDEPIFRIASDLRCVRI
jgi:hypothetical protein